jgi:class 3 adenylate cyclase
MAAIAASTRAAVEYASTHPEAVERLLLWNAYVSTREVSDARIDSLLSLLDGDWEMFTETYGALVGGWQAGDLGHQYAAIVRESMTQEDMKRVAAADRDKDVSALLPLVAAPTLVVSMPESPVPLDAVRKIAAGIPNAQLQTIEGKSVFIRYDSPEIEPWLNAFLTGEEASATSKSESVAPQGQEQGAFRVVLFTDLVGHTEMMQRLGDARGREVLREHERITRDVLAAHGGMEVKADGDGFMMSFTSVARAVECAIALQQAFAAREGEPLSIRVGLNAGEPIAEEDDLFGATVILASRIAAQAAGGEILIPEPIRHLLSGKSFVFSDRGEFVPKGFDDAVRLYEVRWRD